MFFVLKFELILISGSNNVLTEGAALDRAALESWNQSSLGEELLSVEDNSH
jgi:hypothetical protein